MQNINHQYIWYEFIQIIQSVKRGIKHVTSSKCKKHVLYINHLTKIKLEESNEVKLGMRRQLLMKEGIILSRDVLHGDMTTPKQLT